MVRRLRLYPLILVFCWTFATVNRLQNVVDPTNPQFMLYLLHVSTRSLQGILNAVVYGFNSHVTKEWMALLAECKSGRGRGEEEDGAGKGSHPRGYKKLEDAGLIAGEAEDFSEEDENDRRAEGIKVPGTGAAITEGTESSEIEAETEIEDGSGSLI